MSDLTPLISAISVVITVYIYKKSEKRNTQRNEEEIGRKIENELSQVRPVISSSKNNLHFFIPNNQFLTNINVRTEVMYYTNDSSFYRGIIKTGQNISIRSVEKNYYAVIKYTTSKKETRICVIFPRIESYIDFSLELNEQDKKDRKNAVENIIRKEILKLSRDAIFINHFSSVPFVDSLINQIYAHIKILYIEHKLPEQYLINAQEYIINNDTNQAIVEIYRFLGQYELPCNFINKKNLEMLANLSEGILRADSKQDNFFIKKLTIAYNRNPSMPQSIYDTWVNKLKNEDEINLKEFIEDVILLIELEELNTKMISDLFKFGEAIALDEYYNFKANNPLKIIRCIEKLIEQLEGWDTLWENNIVRKFSYNKKSYISSDIQQLAWQNI